MGNRERLVSVPAARSYIEANVGDPILKACMNNVLDGLPAADAVEVVRCKDCEYRLELGVIGNAICDHDEGLMGLNLKDTDFCPYGKRRTEA